MKQTTLEEAKAFILEAKTTPAFNKLETLEIGDYVLKTFISNTGTRGYVLHITSKKSHHLFRPIVQWKNRKDAVAAGKYWIDLIKKDGPKTTSYDKFQAYLDKFDRAKTFGKAQND